MRCISLTVTLGMAATFCVPFALAQCTISLYDASFPVGVGTESGTEWQKTNARVKAEMDGKAYELTGENGGLDIQRNVVFLVFKEAECSVPAIRVTGDPKYYTDALGERLKRLKAAGIAIPRSNIIADIEGETARIKGTIVVAASFFDEHGQPVVPMGMKFLLAEFADQKINRKPVPPAAKSTPAPKGKKDFR